MYASLMCKLPEDDPNEIKTFWHISQL